MPASPPVPSADPLPAGLLVLHGNRLELLAEAVFAWLARHPLGALEEETVLVQSNGMAEWLKMELASAHGICAATRVELPARFIWRAYRAVLGRAAVPALSALDKLPLTWRLMALLPHLAGQPGFEPVAGFLGDGDPARRLQLAQRLADLFDQYQVYRGDWLQDWAEGHDRLRNEAEGGASRAVPVPADQAWQPALWRAVLAALALADQAAARPTLHRRFLQALAQGGPVAPLPRRIVLFGTTHIPQPTLEALCALAAHTQVLMAVPNPCRYHWADIIDGRELLRATQRRHAARGGRELAAVPLQDMHAHGHPLLAAWGRQARDFVRQLDAYDDVARSRARFDLPRVDLFDDGPGASLLAQVQARIRDLVPLAEHEQTPVPAADRSIVFHVAHSAQREVEILHDQLLHLLAHPPGGTPLHPRDVVVMVPDIETFAPALRAVFGQHPRGHARHIPWGIADQRDRGNHPLLVALEWLLRAPQQRFAFSELRGLLEVPAVARRLGLDADDLPTLAAWMAGAGIRWGLHAAQRTTLGLQACGDANTWAFGLRRMLLGYATGELPEGLDGIEPYAEVAGLDAGLAGTLAELLQRLEAWWAEASAARPPAAWGLRLRALVADMLAAGDDDDRALLAAIDQALTAWLQACEAAGFEAPVDLAVVREAWLAAVDEPGGGRRFKAGGVTFCTLLPMRAIPFDVVCLLGMNDGDYPRRSARSDFDLMALPGLARPGDRSRRDDDRQLMLDALLSARRVLHVSWAGRSQRDNQVQPPSVLVAQLRDYLAAGWGAAVVDQRTVEHPLQPFSRRYFEADVEPAIEGTGLAADDGGLLTYASEWRAAHEAQAPAQGSVPGAAQSASSAPAAAAPASLTVATLARFLRNPVKAFFRQRLQVAFDDIEAAALDDEVFGSVGLDRWQLLDEVIQGTQRQIAMAGAPADGAALAAMVGAQVARLKRAGRLPMAGPGALAEAELLATLRPMLAHAQALRERHPVACDKLALQLVHPDVPGLVLDDWLADLRAEDATQVGAMWIELSASRLADKKLKSLRADKLLTAWLRSLVSAACGAPAGGFVVGADVVVTVTPLAPAAALADLTTLHELMRACHEGLYGSAPLPTAVLTGLAFLDPAGKPRTVYEGSGSFGRGRGGGPGEGAEACLARLFPDYASLLASPGFEESTQRLYGPCREWLAGHVSFEALPGHAELPDDDDE